MFSAQDLPVFQKNLLAWYKKNARQLPWRQTKNPYAIWVSEIMLQQTQVKTVIPYYERWLKRFPTLKHLAEADLHDVLRQWAGLGYYRRARMLHQAAQYIQKNFNGKIPPTAQELQKIPGIGRYTAGAIASIAYDEKVPILDGNVIRILTRIFAIADDIGSAKTIKKLWVFAEKILPHKNLGDFNQALMELGATVCLPQNPACLLCPVSSLCKAGKKDPEIFPVKKQKEILEKLETAALILRKNGMILLQRQAEKERWGGLWMFPHWKNKKSLLEEMRLREEDLLHKMTVKHGFTKYLIQLNVYECKRRATGEKSPMTLNLKLSPKSPVPGHRSNQRWVTIKDLSRFAFPAPHQKIVKALIS